MQENPPVNSRIIPKGELTILEILKEYVFLAPYATTIGVVVALIQIWRNAEQSKTTFEDSLTKEYREIIRRIPYKALVGEILDSEEKNEAFNEIFNYMDICNEQIFLRMSDRVRTKTWLNWQEGMKTNFSLPIFDTASKEVFDKMTNNFNELRKVKKLKYNTDPKKWERYNQALNQTG
jgi:hypothetical protein